MENDNPTGIETLPGGRALFPVASGWALDAIVALDDARPGFLAFVCRARLKFRQALWACLAQGGATDPNVLVALTGEGHWHGAGPSNITAEFAAVAPKSGARALIEAAFGSCPDGLLGVLSRLHGQPLSQPELYGHLHRLFVSDDALDHARRTVLQRCAILDESHIRGTLALNDRGLIAPGVLQHLDGEQAAHRLEREVAIVRRLCTWADDEAIQKAILKSRERAHRPFLIAMLARADRRWPETHPCDQDPDLRRFPIGEAREIGRRFRNCLSADRILPQAASGVWAMVTWEVENLLIETRRLDCGTWAVHRVHSAGNQRVRRDTLLKVRTKLAPLGVLCSICAEPEKALSPVSEAFGGWHDDGLVGFDAWD